MSLEKVASLASLQHISEVVDVGLSSLHPSTKQPICKVSIMYKEI